MILFVLSYVGGMLTIISPCILPVLPFVFTRADQPFARSGLPMRFRVLIDGQRPGDDHGADIDAKGDGTVTGQRLYQLVRRHGPVKDRTFEIRFLDPGVQAFAFTFG